MLTRRIIPCLDIKNNSVVKGIKFSHHEVVGDILELAQNYAAMGADELVFYDITASSDQRRVDAHWISLVAQFLDIPFCVAGGIKSVSDAEKILAAGADKISINSPALERPDLIDELVDVFGSQCVVIGVDSCLYQNNYAVFQYTGDETKTIYAKRNTLDWLKEVQERGAGEIVINCMGSDGVKNGYDILQIIHLQQAINVPFIASGGAGKMQHFYEVFSRTTCSGALAASVFHKEVFSIPELKEYLWQQQIEVRTT